MEHRSGCPPEEAGGIEVIQSAFRAIGLVALLLPVGCACTEVKPEFSMEGKKVAVIPFYDRQLGGAFSDEAIALGRAVALDMLENNFDGIDVIRPRIVEKFFEIYDITEMTAREIAEKLSVDYVIHGDIFRFDTQGNIIGMNSGLFKGTVRVYTTRVDAPVYEREVNVAFPRQPMTGLGEGEIRAGLMEATGRKIGRLFYHYEPGEDEGW